MACLRRWWKKKRRVGVSVEEPSSTSHNSRQTVDFSIFAASTSTEAPAAKVCLKQNTSCLSPAKEGPSSPTTDHTCPEEDLPSTPAAPGRATTTSSDTSLSQEELDCLGLPNLGNTCYMNAALQALLTLEPFIDEFCCQVQVASSSSIFRLFGEVVSCRSSDDVAEKEHVLAAFKHIVAQFEPDFDNDDINVDALLYATEQIYTDASLFVTSVLNMLQFASLDLQRAARGLGLSYTCPVGAHIAFQMLKTLTCCRCGMQSTTHHDCDSFELALFPGHSVEQCLDVYLKGQPCFRKCSCGSDTVEHWSFVTLPNVLILPLARFIDMNGVTVKVKMPTKLSRELVISSSERKTARYSLVTIVSHLGHSPDYGHSICESACRDGQGSVTDTWLRYNDEFVSQKSGSSTCRIRQRDAQVLFYEKIRA